MIQAWLGTYASRHPEAEALANTAVILDAESGGPPDGHLRRLPVASLLAGDIAKTLAALTKHEPLEMTPPKTNVKRED